MNVLLYTNMLSNVLIKRNKASMKDFLKYLRLSVIMNIFTSWLNVATKIQLAKKSPWESALTLNIYPFGIYSQHSSLLLTNNRSISLSV